MYLGYAIFGGGSLNLDTFHYKDNQDLTVALSHIIALHMVS
jgi:hypothetical protein